MQDRDLEMRARQGKVLTDTGENVGSCLPGSGFILVISLDFQNSVLAVIGE